MLNIFGFIFVFWLICAIVSYQWVRIETLTFPQINGPWDNKARFIAGFFALLLGPIMLPVTLPMVFSIIDWNKELKKRNRSGK